MCFSKSIYFSQTFAETAELIFAVEPTCSNVKSGHILFRMRVLDTFFFASVLGTFFFRMRFGKHFLQKLTALGLHWGPFGRPWGAFFCNFSDVFSGSDFRLKKTLKKQKP